MRWFRRIGMLLGAAIGFVLTLWAAAALYFDFTFPRLRVVVALLYLAVIVRAIVYLRRSKLVLAVPVVGFLVVLGWWLTLKATNDGDWQPDNAQTASIDFNGDAVTVHNFRLCTYKTEADYTCEWQTRSYDLSKLHAVDIFITWWGSPWIAHPIVSFDFGDQGHIAMSIETRDLVGQSYSAVRGFFRQYALIYVVTDERDVILLRTNYRKGEEVHIFRTNINPETARKLFGDYAARVNQLHNRPEWYNAVTNNCTTNIAVSAAQANSRRTRLDWRVLLNGKSDEMMYEHGGIATGGLPIARLREQAHINSVAQKVGNDPEFSRLIRVGRVGFPEAGAAAGAN
ncbi:conserved hypothetical protein [Candidatus Koribacter versatilis Ellin345]|uniref:Lnb N-terminal periplasmic domain-containing protein n=1 Tax=Koribacter versatilis (strain Ellin345) TaxID=204669 RepID=Q1IPX5_KORVE|nr:DUF4105 domain-containing protein [Candidatus Koribacter versatilis]ABF41075.1 conserved hypothetical protein [Candidatus Koribacter versatilis Ellin345]